MTRKAEIGLVFGAALAAGITMAAVADITGSSHDFSAFGWSQGEICLPCHTPHHAMEAVAPLWNHELTTASYQVYGTGNILPTADALDDWSILCMSCHDGTISLDAFGGSTGTPGIVIGPAGLVGTDLTDDHPVGFTGVYPIGDPEYNDPANWENQPFGFTLRDMDINGQIERVVSCVTCHEPHDGQNQPFMLWKSNLASGLCLTCHLK